MPIDEPAASTIDLSVLTPRQRLVITLHYFDSWSEREIAEGMKLSRRSVRDLHERALDRLRHAHTPTLHL